MSTQTALPELQKAIYTTLTGDTTLMALVTGVFDFGAVATGQAFPYVTIGDSTEVPFNVFGRRGYESTLTLHVWDNARGFKRCYSILARMNYLLDQKTHTLDTQTQVGTWYEMSQTMNGDPINNDVRHLIVRYRMVTQE